MMETLARSSCERASRISCERNSFDRHNFDRSCFRRRRPSFSESEDVRMRRSNSFSDGEERTSGSLCEGSGGIFERGFPSICKRHRLTGNSEWTNFYRWRSSQKNIMQALTPFPVSHMQVSTSDLFDPTRRSLSTAGGESRRHTVTRDLELDCLNESEAPLSRSSQSRTFDSVSSKSDRNSKDMLRPKCRGETATTSDSNGNSLRYGDVGLILGLCSPIATGGDAACSDSAEDDILPLLLKYTHVVGAN